MKTSLLLLLGISLAKAYVFPSLAYDQTQATCDNVQTLLGLSSADLSRFKLAVDVLIPSRIGRNTVVNRAVDRVCGSNNVLVQKSSFRSMATEEGDLDDVCSAAKDAISALADQFQDQEYKLDRLDDMLWSVSETCNQISDRLFDYTTSFLQVSKKSSHLKSGKRSELFSGDLGDLCQDVTDAVDNLSDYLEALQAQVQSLYVEETLPARIKSLTQTGATCLQSSVKSSIQASVSDIQSSIQSNITSSIQNSIQSSVQSSVQAAMASAQSAIQSNITSNLQSSIQSSVKSSIQDAIPSIKSSIQSTLSYPTPTLVRMGSTANWQNILTKTETALSPYTYTVTLPKDTLVEFIANGHVWSVSRRAIFRFYVDDTVITSNNPANFFGLGAQFTNGEYLVDTSTQWTPVNYKQIATVSAGTHTFTFRGYTEDPTGAARLNGAEVLYKIYN